MVTEPVLRLRREEKNKADGPYMRMKYSAIMSI